MRGSTAASLMMMEKSMRGGFLLSFAELHRAIVEMQGIRQHDFPDAQLQTNFEKQLVSAWFHFEALRLMPPTLLR